MFGGRRHGAPRLEPSGKDERMSAVQSPLAPDQVAQIRDELLRSLGKLERSMRSGAASARPRDLEQDTVGRLSRIEALQNAGLAQNLEERERTQFTMIADALRRIEDGTFGACESCGGAIPFDRLMIFPETKSCTTCARG